MTEYATLQKGVTVYKGGKKWKGKCPKEIFSGEEPKKPAPKKKATKEE